MDEDQFKPFRVLTIDGGGMRGLYISTYIETLCRRFNSDRILDIGAAFDLIVGTSTGGIIACGLADAVPIDEISRLYRENGEAIFPSPTPSINGPLKTAWKFLKWERDRTKWASSGQQALRDGLGSVLGDRTIEQVWTSRKIGLCIPAVNMANHQPWVFKTPHLLGKTRDNDYRLVDVCLATSAAPIVLPLAGVNVPKTDQFNSFSDGGLWANNPVMVGMVEALQMADNDQPIEMVSVGPCGIQSGHAIGRKDGNWGLLKWKAGIEIVTTSLDAQSAGYDFIAKQIAGNLKQPCEFVRLPNSAPSAEQAKYISIDGATEMACKVLTDLGRSDAESLHGRISSGDSSVAVVGKIFGSLDEFE